MESLRFHHRKSLCDCDPCMEFKQGCLLKPIYVEIEVENTPLRSSNKINPKRPDAVAVQTHRTRKIFNQFESGLTIDNNENLRIHAEERYGNPNYVYFVGQVVERAQI